jgi:hypothetical protein
MGNNGDIVLRTTTGSITLNNGTVPGATSGPSDFMAVSAHGSGDVLVQAGVATNDAASDVIVNADIGSTSGNLSLLASRNVALNGAAALRTAAGTDASRGSIDVQATGSITQSTSSLITSTGTAARARLVAGQDVTVGRIDLSNGRVGITATSGSVFDADSPNDSVVNVTTLGLRVNAGTGVGQGQNPLETQVAALSARAVVGSS